MRLFLYKIFFYLAVGFITLELILRIFHVVGDIPRASYDEFGLQIYRPFQEGVYDNDRWKVNEHGFLGEHDVKGSEQLLIIGDSFIENIMNPYECKQSYLFKSKNLEAFEIGRSGISFIESLEFYKHYRDIVKPKKTLIYISDEDLKESISNIRRRTDRTQINLDTGQILMAELKNPLLKSIYYHIKSVHFLGQKYRKSKKPPSNDKKEGGKENTVADMVEKLFEFTAQNYDLNQIIFVLREDSDYINLMDQYGLNVIDLKIYDKKYFIPDDGHWNCEGHKFTSNKIFSILKSDYGF